MCHRYLILAICCMSLLIVSLDNTIVNIALPSLRTDLHASVSGLQWMIDAYTLVLASLLVLAGRPPTGRRRRTFQTGWCCSAPGRCCAASRPASTG